MENRGTQHIHGVRPGNAVDELRHGRGQFALSNQFLLELL